MFKNIKAYFAQKKQLRELTLDSLQKINKVVTVLSTLTDTISTIVDSINTDEIQELLNPADKHKEP